jgi:dihydropteroate synthase
LAAGVEIVNDVSGFSWDEEMAKVCVAAGCGVVLMHTRGRPEEWRTLPPLQQKEVVPLVRRGLQQRLQRALETGIERERIVLDPGFGFGILLEQNYALLAGLEELSGLGQPLLAGVSRKTFLGRTLSQLNKGVDAPVGRRESASLAAVTAAILAGAQLVRVHDVRPSREAATIADAILAASMG